MEGLQNYWKGNKIIGRVHNFLKGYKIVRRVTKLLEGLQNEKLSKVVYLANRCVYIYTLMQLQTDRSIDDALTHIAWNSHINNLVEGQRARPVTPFFINRKRQFHLAAGYCLWNRRR